MILAFCLVAGGCATLHTGHLRHNPVGDGPQRIEAKFFRFDYQGVPLSGQYGVKGQAYPLRQNLPAWADSVEDLVIVAYLSDEQGAVLAKDEKTYLPRRLSEEGIPFDLFLKCRLDPGQKVFVSFGYRGTFTASKPSKPASGREGGNMPGQYVFFASEVATLKQ